MSFMWPRTFLVVLALTPIAASANSIWPFAAYYMQQEFLSNLWTIAIALAVEFLVIWRAFAVTPARALAADLLMNVASAFGGALLVFTLAWLKVNIFGEQIINLFGKPPERAAVLVVNFVLLCVINAVIEGGVLIWVFKLPITTRRFIYLLLSNSIGVAASFVGLWLHTAGQPWLNPKSFI